jgi:Tfp pilus assembly protein PilO
MRKISKGRKKIFILIGVAFAVFTVFAVMLYLPTKRRLDRLRSEYMSIQREINEFRTSVGDSRPLADIVINMQKKLDSFKDIFPEREELVLRELPAMAAKVGAEITSIRPSPKRAIKDVGGTPVAIRGCIVQELQVSVTLRAQYKALGEFFRILKNSFPIFVRVDNFQIGKGQGNVLDVSMSLVTYTISHESGMSGAAFYGRE